LKTPSYGATTFRLPRERDSRDDLDAYGPWRRERALTPALLRLDPMFDPLRNDPRFQKLAASPAKEVKP
jgi:hypothetical protein